MISTPWFQHQAAAMRDMLLYHFQRHTLLAGFLTIDYISWISYIIWVDEYHMISTYKLFRYNILRQTLETVNVDIAAFVQLAFFLILCFKENERRDYNSRKGKPRCVIISVWMTRYCRVSIIDCNIHVPLKVSIWLSSSVRH